MKKKNPTLKLVKNTVVGGTGLMLGSMTMGKISGMSTDPSVAKIATTAQGGMQMGALAMPINAAGSVMKSLDQLDTKKRRRK